MTRTLRSRNDDGLATVEFAVVGSLLFVLIFGIISVGLFISAHMRAADEARFQARQLALACTPAQVAANVVVSSTVTKSYPWVVPFIDPPDPAEETVRYRCGA